MACIKQIQADLYRSAHEKKETLLPNPQGASLYTPSELIREGRVLNMMVRTLAASLILFML